MVQYLHSAPQHVTQTGDALQFIPGMVAALVRRRVCSSCVGSPTRRGFRVPQQTVLSGHALATSLRVNNDDDEEDSCR